MIELDHLLWAVPDLDEGIAEMERRTGIRAAYGGRHPGVGTHNAILDLGSQRYLEILAPDPTQDRFSSFGKLVREVTQPTLLSWAARTVDIRHVVETAREAELEPGVVLSLSRRTPSGVMLSWRIVQVEGHDAATLFPFFLEWRGKEHPSDDAPRGARLLRLEIEVPGADRLREALRVFGLQQSVEEGAAPRLRAILETPIGEVVVD